MKLNSKNLEVGLNKIYDVIVAGGGAGGCRRRSIWLATA